MKDQYLGEKISSIYIGGGTPSCLSEEEIIYLLDSIQIFHKAKDCEITFECNVNDITKEYTNKIPHPNHQKCKVFY